MAGLLNWLSTHHSIVSAVATVVIAVSALVTVWLTRSLVKENKLLRNVGEEPRVVAYLESDPRAVGYINFTLANVGRGPARKVEFEFDFDARFFGSGGVAPMNQSGRKPIGFILQGDKNCMYFGSGGRLLGDDPLPPFHAQLRWENLNGRKFRETYDMDVGQFRGMFATESPRDKEIADSLKKIAKRLDSFATVGSTGRLKVETMTATEAREQQKRYLDESRANANFQSDADADGP